ncbi:MAG: fucose isomerase, partial [Rectinema sp.]|nr:fucose isomerase [Rectinema sp.]
MKERIRLGVVCLARNTFDFKAAESLWENIRLKLGTLDQVEIVAPKALIFEIEEAKTAAELLASSRVDGLVIISGTFHLGHLALELVKSVHAPVLLWGLPELPYNGGKIRLNSVCGVNLNASNLYKAGIRNYRVIIGHDIDTAWVDAIRVLKALSRAHVGILGYRAHGFFNLSVADLALYRETGILIDHDEISEGWNFPAPEEKVVAREQQLASIFDVSGISAQQLRRVAELSVKFAGFLDAHALDALAIRCWPEFASQFGISPCAAMSLLQSEDRILACEGDVEGALSMLMH